MSVLGHAPEAIGDVMKHTSPNTHGNSDARRMRRAAKRVDREKRKHPERYGARLYTQDEIDREFPDGYPAERLALALRVRSEPWLPGLSGRS